MHRRITLYYWIGHFLTLWVGWRPIEAVPKRGLDSFWVRGLGGKRPRKALGKPAYLSSYRGLIPSAKQFTGI